MKKKIIILGSTGSIGKTTIEIINKNKNKFQILLLSTNINVKILIKQAKRFNVRNLVINNYDEFIKAKVKYKNTKFRIYNNFQCLDVILKKQKIFYAMISLVGMEGLKPTLSIIKYCKYIAIANKESLICGWNLIKKKLDKYKTKFIPVDSEHFSIFSLIKENDLDIIENIYITASGGPFLNFNYSEFSNITVKQALNHPNWSMGKKISIDSATMMNKLFEVIETKKIFNISYNKIKILIHPKSYVHAVIKFKNGLSKMLFHDPNMKIPIHNSIYFYEKKELKSNNLNFDILNNLKFQSVDYKKFPLLNLLKQLPEKESLYETILIAINDYFVSAFLKKKINYNKLIYLINSYAKKKQFQKFRRICPKKPTDIYKTRKFVDEILTKSGI
jgi:1-deoxy-D-xylulose-5-phosphate reductoisomerase